MCLVCTAIKDSQGNYQQSLPKRQSRTPKKALLLLPCDDPTATGKREGRPHDLVAVVVKVELFVHFTQRAAAHGELSNMGVAHAL